MMWRVYSLWVVAAVACGVVWGGVRGSGYPPTLFFALVEGGVIFGVIAAVLGIVAVGAFAALRRLVSAGRAGAAGQGGAAGR